MPVFAGISVANDGENNNNKMITIALLLALLVCCRLFFKSIDWFEKI